MVRRPMGGMQWEWSDPVIGVLYRPDSETSSIAGLPTIRSIMTTKMKPVSIA